MENVWTFQDYYQNEVKFTFEKNLFSEFPLHVWVISMYKDKWLLTRHPDRGLEFPGGKVEEGETPEIAAKREVFEETGGIVRTLHYLGQYQVTGKSETIVKNVYVATINDIKRKSDYMETEGPVLQDTIPNNVKTDPHYSFMMKDDVLIHSLNYIKNHILEFID